MGFWLHTCLYHKHFLTVQAFIFLVLISNTICATTAASKTTVESTRQRTTTRGTGTSNVTPFRYVKTTTIPDEGTTPTVSVSSTTTTAVQHTEIVAMPPVIEEQSEVFELTGPQIFYLIADDGFETTKATTSMPLRLGFALRIPSDRVETTLGPTPGVIPLTETYAHNFYHAVSHDNLQAISGQSNGLTTQTPRVPKTPQFAHPIPHTTDYTSRTTDISASDQMPKLQKSSYIANNAFRMGMVSSAKPALLTSQVQSSTSTPSYRIPNGLSDKAINLNTSISTPITQEIGLQHHKLSALLDSVLLDYDRRLRPRNDQLQLVTIFTDFVPLSIIEFNTQEQSFSVMGYFKMDWRDDFLTWDPSAYDNTKTLRIPARSVWVPKLTVDKANDGNGVVGDVHTDIVLINYRGYVRWFPEGIYSFVCRVTIKFYPFDLQTCTLTYFIADEDNTTVRLKHDGEVDLSEYIENAEWNLINLTAESIQTDNLVNFIFTVERRGGFTMFTLIVPILMLSLLNGATFLIPIESGEKCSFSVTIFLAYGIFETIVIDTLPHNSLDVSYFIIYLTSMLIISILLTFYTILQAKVFDVIGNKEFRILQCCTHGDVISWRRFLQNLDTYIFVVFLVFVVGFTSTFFGVMSEKFDFL